MTAALQLFVERTVDEPSLLAVIGAHVSGGVESLDMHRPGARFFAMMIDYSQGFRTGVNLSRVPDDDSLDEVGLATALARDLSTRVLWESGAGDVWSMVGPDGRVRTVAVRELEDGMMVAG